MRKQTKSSAIILFAAMQIPVFLIYSLFFTWPTFQVIRYSFVEWNGYARAPKIFVGFENYINLFQDKAFFLSLRNTLVFIVVAFVVLLPLSLGIALLLNTDLRGKGFFKTVYYLPALLPTTVAGLMWIFMMSSPASSVMEDPVVTQIINILTGLNLKIRWLSSKQMAIWSVALVQTWRICGHYMLFFLTGISAIPQDMLESGYIDGAGAFKRLIYLILPNMKETFKLFIILNLSGAIQMFDLVYVMTAGGPGDATQVPVTLLYNYAFRFSGSFGYGSTIGVVILIITIAIAIVTNRYLSQEQA